MPRKDAAAETPVAKDPAPSSGKGKKKDAGSKNSSGDDPMRLLKLLIVPVVALSGLAIFASSRKSTPPPPAGKPLPELNNETFDRFVGIHFDGCLVSFHMPNCVHCKKLKPEMEAAMAMLVKDRKTAPFAALDGQEYPDIVEHLNITRYPTVFWFWKSAIIQELPPTSRTAEKIYEWVQHMKETALVQFESRAQLEENLPALREAMGDLNRPVIAGFGGDPRGRAIYELTSMRMKGKAVMLHVGESAADGMEIRAYGREEAADRTFDRELSPASLKEWVQELIGQA